MKTSPIVAEIAARLEEAKEDSHNVIDARRFHREKLDEPHVLRTPIVRKIAARYYLKVKHKSRDEIFALCEELLEEGIRTVAFDWADRCRKHLVEDDLEMFERWLERYVDNWGSCDDLCTHALGFYFLEYPYRLPAVKGWARRPDRWFRRASAVSVIPSLRKARELKICFDVAEILIIDDDDLVQKGCGWMLKEASKHFQSEIFDFVLERRGALPRTVLRYAVEAMPPRRKKEAMKKENK